LVNLPFSRRRELLESPLAAADDPLRVSPLLQAPSTQVLEAVRKLRLEGVVGKRIEGHLRHCTFVAMGFLGLPRL
jgi:ATP-dependent DNA ligase